MNMIDRDWLKQIPELRYFPQVAINLNLAKERYSSEAICLGNETALE